MWQCTRHACFLTAVVVDMMESTKCIAQVMLGQVQKQTAPKQTCHFRPRYKCCKAVGNVVIVDMLALVVFVVHVYLVR